MNDHYVKNTNPENPFDFTEGEKWCRNIDVEDKDIVENLISASVEMIEQTTNRIIQHTSFTGFFSNYQYSTFENYPFVELRKSPFVSIDSVKINNTTVTSFIIKDKLSFPRILFPNFLPLDHKMPYPVEINFFAGYEKSIGIPVSLLNAMKQLVLFWYENRGDVTANTEQRMPLIIKPVIKQHRIINTF